MSSWRRFLNLDSRCGICQTTGAGNSFANQPTSANTPRTQYFRSLPRIRIKQLNPFAINDLYKSGESSERPALLS
jgi:hypothetical protein